MRELPVLTGWLSLVPPESGGRSGPVKAGYRPQARIPRSLRIPGDDSPENASYDCAIDLEGIQELPPGSTAHVRVTPLAPEFWVNVRPGSEIMLAEGARTVGTLRVEIGLDPVVVAAERRAADGLAHPADLDERVARIRRAMGEFIRGHQPRDIP